MRRGKRKIVRASALLTLSVSALCVSALSVLALCVSARAAEEIPVPCLDRFLSLTSRDVKEVALADCADSGGEITRSGGAVIWKRPRGASGEDSGFLRAEKIGEIADGAEAYLLFDNSGGSGVFTFLIAARREEALLRKILDVPGGDRCSGGLRKASVEKERILIERRMTPYMIAKHLTAFSDSPDAKGADGFTLFGRDDWPYCAICCVARREESYSASGDLEEGGDFLISQKDLYDQSLRNDAAACLLRALDAPQGQAWIRLRPENMPALAAKLGEGC